MRLVGGLTAAEGRVEVNYKGTWGTVCNDSYWGLNDAMVVCRMLGYSSVLAAHVKYGQGSGNVWMSNLACTGSESNISECPHLGWGETSCSHSQDAGVTCGGECFSQLMHQRSLDAGVTCGREGASHLALACRMSFLWVPA